MKRNDQTQGVDGWHERDERLRKVWWHLIGLIDRGEFRSNLCVRGCYVDYDGLVVRERMEWNGMEWDVGWDEMGSWGEVGEIRVERKVRHMWRVTVNTRFVALLHTIKVIYTNDMCFSYFTYPDLSSN